MRGKGEAQMTTARASTRPANRSESTRTASQSVIVLTPGRAANEAPRAVLVPLEVQEPRPPGKQSAKKAPRLDASQTVPRKKPSKKQAKAPPRRPPLAHAWRIGAGVALSVFVALAIFRGATPGGVAYAAVYGATALLALGAVLGLRPRWTLPAVLTALTTLWALASLPALARREGVEDLPRALRSTRSAGDLQDLGGLALVALATGVLALHLKPAPAPERRSMARFKARR
jgi:hypothetical protein